MPKLKFIFGVHNHQPVGNFDFVIEDAYQKAYLPFLQVIKEYPWFRFTLHNSGCLWEWLEQHHPEYLELVRSMAASGQMELMGGGFYEPILPAIPAADQQGQLKMMSRYLKDKLGQDPFGAWVAERVWEPGLASVLAAAGIRYTVLDDYHFKCAGKPETELDGYYLTEDQGNQTAVFPISQKLRYLVPFHNVSEVIEHLRSLHHPERETVAVLADDGEKFGVWPGTHELAYKKGWLKEFLSALKDNSEWLEVCTFAEALVTAKARGRVYLPTASYAEMGEWALEPESEAVYQELAGRLKAEGSFERYSPFVRGGIWRGFFTKYPEANNIYRKMLHVSRKAQSTMNPEVIRELYRGQCNCGYWHGIFGGLYLPHLREALYRHLIRAENLLLSGKATEKKVSMALADFDGDGREEILLSNDLMNLYLSPSAGASAFEWDIKEKEVNLFDTLARRRESYHRNISQSQSQAGAQSIHEMTAAKEEGLQNYLFYDSRRRTGLIDHLLGPETDLDSFYRSCHTEQEPELAGAWEAKTDMGPQEAVVVMSRKLNGLSLTKRLAFGAGRSFNVEYIWANTGEGQLNIWPGIEFNFGLLSSGFGRFCRSADRALSDERLDSRVSDDGLSHLSVVDDYRKLEIHMELDAPWDLWRFPVETVSQSEAGLERNYQCSCFLWHKKISLAPGRVSSLKLTIGYRILQ
jgi:alpha-amylase/alpha-mannosidase (GH57 family)